MASDEEWLERIEREGVEAFDGRRYLDLGESFWLYEPSQHGYWFVSAEVKTYGGYVTEVSTGHALTAEAALEEAREGVARIQAKENNRRNQGTA